MMPMVTQRMKSSSCTGEIGAGPFHNFALLISPRAYIHPITMPVI
jgi:hypothetical protein